MARRSFALASAVIFASCQADLARRLSNVLPRMRTY
jgi:hypothetical protein